MVWIFVGFGWGGWFGGLDIWFCTKAREKGFRIVQVEGEADHLQLIQLGEKGVNHGLHKIELKPRILNNQVIERG